MRNGGSDEFRKRTFRYFFEKGMVKCQKRTLGEKLNWNVSTWDERRAGRQM